MDHRINFTKETLNSLPLPESGTRAVYHDKKAAGLQLRVTSTGTKTFSIYRRIKGGQPERITLGKFPTMTVEQARKQAALINAEIEDGSNPAEVKRAHKEEPTFRELFKEYGERHGIKKRSWATDQSLFANHLHSLAAEQATGTVAESATRSLAESATRKEHKKEHNQVNRKSSQSVNPGFDLFYSAYPKKKARHDALHAWTKLNPDERLLSTILLAVQAAKHSPEWLKSGGEFIPLPATWIRGRRWEDEVNAAPKTYAASELEVIERYNAVLSEASWPVAVASPYREERAEAVREFLTFGSKANWIEMYFTWLRDNLDQ